MSLRRPRIEGARADGGLRLAPALRGVGLLARIPQSDPVGRFGWKAEVPTLAAQVALALSLDMGLSSSAHPAASGDCTQRQPDCLRLAGVQEPEVPTADIDSLVAYLAALRPRPTPSIATRGATFVELGCAACHRQHYVIPSDPAVTGLPHETIRPFTDMALHDLGAELADPPAVPRAHLWRTAPLWGLGAARFLLHDGRARSPIEAILWHGGEAQRARDRFRSAPAAIRADLLAYLASL